MNCNIKYENRTDFYEKYLIVLNPALVFFNQKPFTKQERKILASFLVIQEELGKNATLTFSSDMRKRVQDELDLSEQNLNNYISTLVSKFAIIRNGDKLRINDNILPRGNNVIFSFSNGTT